MNYSINVTPGRSSWWPRKTLHRNRPARHRDFPSKLLQSAPGSRATLYLHHWPAKKQDLSLVKGGRLPSEQVWAWTWSDSKGPRGSVSLKTRSLTLDILFFRSFFRLAFQQEEMSSEEHSAFSSESHSWQQKHDHFMNTFSKLQIILRKTKVSLTSVD